MNDIKNKRIFGVIKEQLPVILALLLQLGMVIWTISAMHVTIEENKTDIRRLDDKMENDILYTARSNKHDITVVEDRVNSRMNRADSRMDHLEDLIRVQEKQCDDLTAAIKTK